MVQVIHRLLERGVPGAAITFIQPPPPPPPPATAGVWARGTGDGAAEGGGGGAVAAAVAAQLGAAGVTVLEGCDLVGVKVT
jgi:hypothetical protein